MKLFITTKEKRKGEIGRERVGRESNIERQEDHF